MKKTTLTLILGIIIGGLLASVVLPKLSPNSQTNQTEKMHHHEDSDNHLHMNPIEVDPLSPPKIDLVIHKDSVKGWNLQILLKNFKFSGAHVSSDPIPGEGHLHLIVDNEKISRIYGEWFYLSPEWLHKGKNTITVTMNANNHSPYTLNGEIIQDNKTINIL